MISEADQEPLWRELSGSKNLAGRKLHFLGEVDSTNEVALALARRGQTEALVVAESQSRGRGRLARSWHSPPGVGIYLSLLYWPRLVLEDLAKLTLSAGLALALALEKTTNMRPGLKWPNDLLLAEELEEEPGESLGGKVLAKKCGGILCECCLDSKIAPVNGLSLTSPGDLTPVVVGIGLNVNHTLAQIPAELRSRTSSLRLLSGRFWDRGQLLPAIVNEMDRLVAKMERGEFAAILAAWQARDALRGRELKWLTPAKKVVCGVALGPDLDGILRIRDRQGQVHEIISGDLDLVRD